MKVPSRKAKTLHGLHQERRHIQERILAPHVDDAEAKRLFDSLLSLKKQIAEAEAAADTYTCPQCGNDFEDSAHIDLLVASLVVYGDDGIAIARDHRDYGIGDARRVKICGPCHRGWAIPVQEYLEK